MTNNFVLIDFLLFKDFVFDIFILCIEHNIEPSDFFTITCNACCVHILQDIEMCPE